MNEFIKMAIPSCLPTFSHTHLNLVSISPENVNGTAGLHKGEEKDHRKENEIGYVSN